MINSADGQLKPINGPIRETLQAKNRGGGRCPGLKKPTFIDGCDAIAYPLAPSANAGQSPPGRRNYVAGSFAVIVIGE
jgi:hypothetical protein